MIHVSDRSELFCQAFSAISAAGFRLWLFEMRRRDGQSLGGLAAAHEGAQLTDTQLCAAGRGRRKLGYRRECENSGRPALRSGRAVWYEIFLKKKILSNIFAPTPFAVVFLGNSRHKIRGRLGLGAVFCGQLPAAVGGRIKSRRVVQPFGFAKGRTWLRNLAVQVEVCGVNLPQEKLRFTVPSSPSR